MRDKLGCCKTTLSRNLLGKFIPMIFGKGEQVLQKNMRSFVAQTYFPIMIDILKTYDVSFATQINRIKPSTTNLKVLK